MLGNERKVHGVLADTLTKNNISNWNNVIAYIGNNYPDFDLTLLEPQSFAFNGESKIMFWGLRDKWLTNNFRISIHPITKDLINYK